MTAFAAALVLIGAAIVGLVVAVLFIEASAIERAGDRFDYGLTPDDAPRDDGDFPPDPRVIERRLNGEA